MIFRLEKQVGLAPLVVAGHVVIDNITDSEDQSIPREALGGAVSYSSICLQSLGHKAEVITRIGHDFPGEFSKFLVTNGGIDVEKWRCSGFKTTRYEIDRSVEPRRLRLAAKCKDLNVTDFAAYFSNSHAHNTLLVDSVAGEISLELLERISKEFDLVFVDSQGFVRAFEYDGRVSMNSGLNISSLSGVDFLKADVDELLAWTGSSRASESVRQLSTFVPNILLTSGKGKVEFYENGKLILTGFPPVTTARDNTGAGDVMLSAFAARYLESSDPREALLFSTAAASLAVRKQGIQKAVMNKKEIIEQMKIIEIVE